MRLKDKLSRLTAPVAPAPRSADPAPSTVEPPPSAQSASDALADALSGESEPLHDPQTGEVLPPGDARRTRIERLRAQLDFMQGKERVFEASKPARPKFSEAEAQPPGQDESTQWGGLRKVFTVFEDDHHHGQARVAAALDADPDEIAILALDPQLSQVDLRRALYVDTETTGLSGGSGTLPFLIGGAWFEGESFRVEQLLLRRPGEEAPMLHRLAERMREASCLVSYNGKSFDWPLLRTRFIMNRVPCPPVPPHLDLLHCARRVFKRRLGAVRLVHLEEQVLGFERVDDIPGELIPRTYLDFVRGRAPGAALAGIVEHNVHDLVALAAFLGELSRRFRKQGAGEDARDSLGFAEVAARASQPGRAIAMAEAAADADVRGELAPQALYLAGKLAQKRGDVDAALDAHLRAVQAAGADALAAAPAHLALAKLYEHKRKDPVRALQHAQHTAPEEGEEGQGKRCARLRRRVERDAQNCRLGGSERLLPD